MPLRKLEQERRLAICSLIIELMAPVEGTIGLSCVDNLVLCALTLSTFGPHRLSAQKIADTTGIPLTTTRRSLRKLVAEGRAVLEGAHYVVAPAFRESVARLYDMQRKGKVIRRTAARLILLKAGAPERRPKGLDGAAPKGETSAIGNGLAQGSK